MGFCSGARGFGVCGCCTDPSDKPAGLGRLALRKASMMCGPSQLQTSPLIQALCNPQPSAALRELSTPGRKRSHAGALRPSCRQPRSRHSGSNGTTTSSGSKSDFRTISVPGKSSSRANRVACGTLVKSIACRAVAAHSFRPVQ